METNGWRRNIESGANFMKKTKSSKKVTNLAFAESPSVGISMKNGITSLVLLAKSSTKRRAAKVKQKKPKTKVAPCAIPLDYRTPSAFQTKLSLSVFQPELSLKPSLIEVNQIIAATYDILNKAGINFESVEEDNLFHDSLSFFLENSFDCQASNLNRDDKF